MLKNPVQTFIRNLVRFIIWIPLLMIFVIPHFTVGRGITGIGELLWMGMKFFLIMWFGNTIAKIFHILPEWQRIVLLRLGKCVGAKGPGVFIIPPFIYSVARILDIRITTYEVKATKTLTKDNIPIDVTAAVEMEIEDPVKAAISVQNYWKTTEWASMEAFKSTIGGNDLRLLLSETDRVAADLKKIIDGAAKDYGVNVRAVRITDVGTPSNLVEELAVIARAERSAKAKKIQATAEMHVAEALTKAAERLATQPDSMKLRQIQALLEISKEESAMVIVYPMDSMMGQSIAAAAAGNQTGPSTKPVELMSSEE